MAGIRGHSIWEGLLPLLLLYIVMALSLRGRPNGWLIALAVPALLGMLVGLAALVSTLRHRWRYANLVMLRDLATATASDQASKDAQRLAGKIVRSDAPDYREALQGMTSFVAAAQGSTEAARFCRHVLFRHAPWNKELERDIAAMRYQLIEGEHAAWLEWFLHAQVGLPEFADRVADAATYALPRIPEPDRSRLLIHVVSRAARRESWIHLGKLFDAELRALDRANLTSYQREWLVYLLREEAAV